MQAELNTRAVYCLPARPRCLGREGRRRGCLPVYVLMLMPRCGFHSLIVRSCTRGPSTAFRQRRPGGVTAVPVQVLPGGRRDQHAARLQLSVGGWAAAAQCRNTHFDIDDEWRDGTVFQAQEARAELGVREDCGRACAAGSSQFPAVATPCRPGLQADRIRVQSRMQLLIRSNNAYETVVLSV